MQVQNQNASLSLIAGEDLSDYQYCLVRLSADNTVKVTTQFPTVDSLGVLMNKPESAAEALVAIAGGVCKVVLGATLTYGAVVSAEEATGKAIAVASTYRPAGILLNGGAEDDVVDMLILPTLLPKA